jgi:glycerol-3-phosphate acyltransferase PlsY
MIFLIIFKKYAYITINVWTNIKKLFKIIYILYGIQGDKNMNILFFIVAAYILGSIPTALIIGKVFYNKDIRQEGSGNLGGTNAGRVLGKNVGIAVSVLDILKVFIPTLLAKKYLGFDTAALIGIFAMLGHCYPLFAGFRGGKGVSSYFGIGLALNPIIAGTLFVIWIILRRITNYVSLSSMIACFSASFVILYIYGPISAFYVMLAGSLFIVYLHRANIQRLLNGTENKVRK